MKIYNHPLRSLWIILKDALTGDLRILLNTYRYVPDLRQKALRSFEILRKNPLPPACIGNPQFVNELDYEQDKIVPVHQIINHVSCEQAKRIVDQFIAFNHELLRIGVIDAFFNMMRNFGLNQAGDIILADLGELITDKAIIAKNRRERRWAVPYKLQ